MQQLVLMTAALTALFALPAVAQTPPSMRSVLQDVFALYDFSNVAISPQGDALAWQEEFHPPGLAHPKRQRELFIERIGSVPVRLNAGASTVFHHCQ